MKPVHMIVTLGFFSAVLAQSASEEILVNLDTAKWTHEDGAPAGSEGVMLRVDKATGGMDLLVRFPAGHVIAPHWHDSNEHIFIAEGQLVLHQDSGDQILKPGGFAFLPAHEVQRLSCSSQSRCTFYLSWDGKSQSHPAK